MENKWYKYKDRIINLSVYDEFKVIESRSMGQDYYEIVCCVKSQTQDWFRYSSLEEAQLELEKIHNILSK